MQLKKVLLSSILLLIIHLNSLTYWDLELLEEIEYKEIKNFEGINYSSLSILHENMLTFFNNYQHFFLDLNSLELNKLGVKGKGPGEFLASSSLVEIELKKYCIDKEKRSFMIFDNENNLVKECILDFLPLSILKLDDKKIGLFQLPLDENEEVINFYSLGGEFLYKKFKPINKISKYKSFPELSFLYYHSYLLRYKENIYLFFNWVPYFIEFNLKDNSTNLISYKKDLIFRPGLPVINLSGGNIVTAGLYYNEMIGSYKNSWILRASNRKSENEIESKNYLLMIDKVSLILETIIIPKNKFKHLYEQNLFIYKNKFYAFNDNDEKVYIYKILHMEE